MKIPENATVGEAYAPAMKITDKAEALEYLEALVERNMKLSGKAREEAEEVERANLGYFAGYYDNETRERVEKLFACAQPVFGAIATKGPVTPEEAFALGMKLGAESRKNVDK